MPEIIRPLGEAALLVRFSFMLLVLSLVVPSLGLVYGTARGIAIQSLGGVVISYWCFLVASMATASLAAAEPAARTVLFMGAVAGIVPVNIKIAARVLGLTSRNKDKMTNNEPCWQPPSHANKCQPIRADREPAHEEVKWGISGRLGWHFWIANFYEWNLHARIEADDRGVSVEASAKGTVSTWYSLRESNRNAEARTQGHVECDWNGLACLPTARGHVSTRRDEDYIVRVSVNDSKSGERTILKAGYAVSVQGAGGSQFTAGVSGTGINTGLTIDTPQSAQDEISEEISYSYRCTRT